MAPPTDVNRILCIRPDGLGDMIGAMPAFESLRAVYPAARITVLTSRLSAPLLEGHPSVTDSILYDPKGADRRLGRLLATARTVRRRRFDLVLALRTSTATHLIAGLSGARYRVGYTGKPFARALTHRRSGGHEWGTFHEIERNLRLLALIGVPPLIQEPRLRLSEHDTATAAAWFRAHGVPPDAPLIVVHPGASSVDKCWPEDRFGAAASALAAAAGNTAHVLVVGHPDEADRVRRVWDNLTVPATAPMDLTVRQMAAILKSCRLALVNDSGPMHIAAALGVPSGVYSPTTSAASSECCVYQVRSDSNSFINEASSRSSSIRVKQRVPASAMRARGVVDSLASVRPRACAHSTKTGSLSVAKACSGVLERFRLAWQRLLSGPSNINKLG